MSYCLFEAPAFFRENVRTARKQHVCCECTAPIHAGEKYYSQAGLWDGYFDSFAQHLLCRDACVWVRDVLFGECVPFGGLFEWVSGCRNVDQYLFGEGKQEVTGKRRRIGMRMFAMIRARQRVDQPEVKTEARET